MTHVVTVATLQGSRNVWLLCTCGWKAIVGIHPSLEHVLEVANDHLAGAKAAAA